MGGPANWSIDASSNDTADPDILLVEGQAPPTLNNAVRAVMAGMKRGLLDVSGVIVAAGANALVVTTYQGLTEEAFDEAFELAFRVQATNNTAVRLKVDTADDKPLRRPGNTELPPGELIPNTVYRVVWLPNLGAFHIVSPHIERPGRIVPNAALTPEPGYVLCDGAAYSRASYAALFARIGTVFGPGDGSTTFNVPDAKGRSLFGIDTMGGPPANRLTGAGGLAGALGSTGGNQVVTLSEAQLASHDHTASTAQAGAIAAGTTGDGGAIPAGTTGSEGGHTPTGTATAGGNHDHGGTTSPAGGHAHDVHYNRADAGSGGGDFAKILTSSGTTSGSTDSVPNHTHPFTTDDSGPHTHALSMAAVPDHSHTTPARPAHSHPTPAIPAHAHDVTVAAAGGGQAHPNIPPGLVVAFAIKA